jgi:hypothetical protein
MVPFFSTRAIALRTLHLSHFVFKNPIGELPLSMLVGTYTFFF